MIAFVLINFGSFASTGIATKPKTEAKISLALAKQVKISNVKYDKKQLICGFTVSYDDGAGNAWSTQYDCTGMTWPDVDNFLLSVFFRSAIWGNQ